MTTKTNDWDEVIEQRVKYAQAWLDTADTQTQDLVFTLLKQKDKETALVVEKERERIFFELHKKIFLFGMQKSTTSHECIMFYDLMKSLEDYAETEGIELDKEDVETQQ